MDHLKPPTEIELIDALEAAAAVILEATCTCKHRAHKSDARSHEQGCNGVAGAHPYRALAKIARNQQPPGHAPPHGSANHNDGNAIDERVRKLALGNVWIVLRRWREGSEIRVIYSGSHLSAQRAFAREEQGMRNGMLALVDAGQHIVKYILEPLRKLKRKP